MGVAGSSLDEGGGRVVVVVLDESEDLASNSPPVEGVDTSPGSLFLYIPILYWVVRRIPAS